MSTRGRAAGAALALVALVSVTAACAGTRSAGPAPRAPQVEPVQAAPQSSSLVSWGRHHAGMFTTLSYDTSTVADYASTYDTTALAGACDKVRSDVETYLALPPIPDLLAASHLKAALDLYGQGTSDCIEGATTGNGGMIERAAAELDQAGAQLYATHQALHPDSTP